MLQEQNRVKGQTYNVNADTEERTGVFSSKTRSDVNKTTYDRKQFLTAKNWHSKGAITSIYTSILREASKKTYGKC